jgi:hypothetical protein
MEEKRPSVLGMAVKAIFTVAATPVLMALKAAHFVTSDPAIAAAGRQGLDELGEALKAFPESIQKSEYGTLFNPYPSEAAHARQGNGMHGHSSRTPGDLPTPGQLVRQHRANLGQEQGRGQEHDNSQEREHERGLERGRA